MNKRGQTVFYTLMLAIVVVVLALGTIGLLKQVVDTSRGPSTDEFVGLDCSNSSINDFAKAQCVLTDISTPYWFFGLLGIAGAILAAKVVYG